MAFDFYQEIHGTRTFFRKLQRADSLDTVSRPLISVSTKQSFSNVLVAYLFKSGISEVREIIFKSYRIVCRHGRLKHCCIYRHRCFEHSLVKLSRLYVVIGVTDVKDYTSNNITWDLSCRLRTHPTQNKYKKIVVLKLMSLLIEANHGQSIERRIFTSRPVKTTDLDKYANKMFKNYCFIDLEVCKLSLRRLSLLLAVIPKKCLRPVFLCL